MAGCQRKALCFACSIMVVIMSFLNPVMELGTKYSREQTQKTQWVVQKSSMHCLFGNGSHYEYPESSGEAWVNTAVARHKRSNGLCRN